MLEPITCPHCKHSFEPSRDQIGGLVKCPHCQRVVDVPGLNDPLWWLLRVGILIAAIGAGAWFGRVDPWHGVLAGAVVLGGAWLVSRAL